jgi:hypothetical protein
MCVFMPFVRKYVLKFIIICDCSFKKNCSSETTVDISVCLKNKYIQLKTFRYLHGVFMIILYYDCSMKKVRNDKT